MNRDEVLKSFPKPNPYLKMVMVAVVIWTHPLRLIKSCRKHHRGGNCQEIDKMKQELPRWRPTRRSHSSPWQHPSACLANNSEDSEQTRWRNYTTRLTHQTTPITDNQFFMHIENSRLEVVYNNWTGSKNTFQEFIGDRSTWINTFVICLQ